MWEKEPILNVVIQSSEWTSAVGTYQYYVVKNIDTDPAIREIGTKVKVVWNGTPYVLTGVAYGDSGVAYISEGNFVIAARTGGRSVAVTVTFDINANSDVETSIQIYFEAPPVPVFNDSKQVFQTDEHTVVYFDMNTGDWLIHSNNGWINNGDLYGESKEVVHEARVGTAIVGTDVVAEGESPQPIGPDNPIIS